MALENQAVESSDRAGYRIPVQITESGHVDLARVRWFTASEVGAAISLKSIWRGWDRCRLWLWPQAALSQAASWSDGAGLVGRHRWPKISRTTKRLRQGMNSALLFPSAVRRRA